MKPENQTPPQPPVNYVSPEMKKNTHVKTSKKKFQRRSKLSKRNYLSRKKMVFLKLMIIVAFFFTMCSSSTFSISVKTLTDKIIKLDVENIKITTINTIKIQIEEKENILRRQYILKFGDQELDDDDLTLDHYNIEEQSIISLIYTEKYIGWKKVTNVKCADFDNLVVSLVKSQEECQELAKKQKSLVFHWKNEETDGEEIYECKVCRQAQPLNFLANETETADIITYVYFGGYEYSENSRLTNIIAEWEPKKKFDSFYIHDWYLLDTSDHDQTFGFFQHSANKDTSYISMRLYGVFQFQDINVYKFQRFNNGDVAIDMNDRKVGLDQLFVEYSTPRIRGYVIIEFAKRLAFPSKKPISLSDVSDTKLLSLYSFGFTYYQKRGFKYSEVNCAYETQLDLLKDIMHVEMDASELYSCASTKGTSYKLFQTNFDEYFKKAVLRKKKLTAQELWEIQKDTFATKPTEEFTPEEVQDLRILNRIFYIELGKCVEKQVKPKLNKEQREVLDELTPAVSMTYEPV